MAIDRMWTFKGLQISVLVLTFLILTVMTGFGQTSASQPPVSPMPTSSALASPSATPANSPTPSTPPVEKGQDSNPVSTVFLQIRNEYINLNGSNWINATILRSDKAFFRKRRFGGKVGVITRWDVPFVISKSGPATHAGLGDIYLQAIQFPKLTRRGGFGVGTGLSVPTATHKTLGTGKWTIAPIGIPVWFFGRGNLAFIKFQQFVSFAGAGSRPDLSYLLVTPLVRWRVKQKSWVILTAESRTNFKPVNSTWYKAGIQFGHIVSKKLAVWVEPNILWGPTRPGNFSLKFSFVRNR